MQAKCDKIKRIYLLQNAKVQKAFAFYKIWRVKEAAEGTEQLKRFYNYSMLIVLVVFLAVERILSIAAAGGSPGASAMSWLMETLLTLPAILIGLSFHEFAHAKVAQLCGDPTPGSYGRLSLSPAAHIDPMGFVALLFLGFGWGMPVPINSSYFKKRRSGEILVGLAGVAMNLAVAVVTGLVMKLLLTLAPAFCTTSLGGILLYIFVKISWVNLVLMGFNLIPVPPLDGFNVLANLLKFRNKQIYYDIYNKGMLLLVILVVFNIPGKLIIGPLFRLGALIFQTIMGIPWAYLLLISPL